MAENFKTIQTDVLIIGSGYAGGRAAVEAGRNNVSVILLEKGFMGKQGSTAMAGQRAVEGPTDEKVRFQFPALVRWYAGVTPESRFKDFLKLGCYLNDQDLLWIGCQESNANRAEIKKIAAEMGARAYENFNNVLGYEISKHPNVRVLENIIVTKLLTNRGKVVGAAALDVKTGDIICFKAKATILATGGYGDLFWPSECSPLAIRGGVFGDGQALAYHAGAGLVEMEMSQQQTLPDTPKWNKWCRHLLQGEGGFWATMVAGPYYDKNGKIIESLSMEAFDKMPCGCGPPGMLWYCPQREMALYKALQKGPVYVDLVAKIKDMAKRGIVKDASEYPLTPIDKMLQVDVTKIPRMSVTLGGLIGQGGPKINEKCETNVPGLYAAGECPGNVYGSYRSGGFMDSCLTFGRRAGKYAAEYAKTAKQGDVDAEEVSKEQDRIDGFLKPKKNPISAYDLKKKVWAVTGKYLFMVRNEKGLKTAIKEIDELRKKDLARIQAVNIKNMNLELIDAVEATFMLDVAEMIAQSALYRTESRGCHYREDFPEMDNKKWVKHTLLRKDPKTGEMKLSTAPVVMTKFKPPSQEGGEPIPI